MEPTQDYQAIDESLIVQLDWIEYYRCFSQEHGGYPIQLDDKRILFRDGWTYSLLRYEGPEWAPPKDVDELLKLKCLYWDIRYRELKMYEGSIIDQVATLHQLQDSRSMPLKQVHTSWNEDTQSITKSTTNFAWGEWEVKVSTVRRMLNEAHGERMSLQHLMSERARVIEDQLDEVAPQ